jgi:hypothetical protein
MMVRSDKRERLLLKRMEEIAESILNETTGDEDSDQFLEIFVRKWNEKCPEEKVRIQECAYCGDKFPVPEGLDEVPCSVCKWMLDDGKTEEEVRLSGEVRRKIREHEGEIEELLEKFCEVAEPLFGIPPEILRGMKKQDIADDSFYVGAEALLKMLMYGGFIDPASIKEMIIELEGLRREIENL